MLLDTWVDMAKYGSCDILTTIFKSIQQMAGKCRDCVFARFDEMWRVFMSSVACVVAEKPDPRAHARSMVVKLVPSIIETFACIFTPENAKDFPHAVLADRIQTGLLELMKKLLAATSRAEGAHGISSPIKLLSEEKTMFDFVETLPVIYAKEDSYAAYFDFLLDMLVFRIDDPHSDAFIRRAIAIIRDFIIARNMSLGLVKRLIPQLYPRFGTIISLRFQNDACKTLLFNAKDSQPLWYAVGERFVQVSSYLVNPQMFKDNFRTSGLAREPTADSTGETATSLKEALGAEGFGDRVKALMGDKELQDLVWDQIIKLIKGILRVSDASLNSLDRALAEEVVKKSQDLDITLVNFILKVLLPSSSGLPKESQEDLINLIDNGCTAFYSSFGASSSSQNRAGDTLSKFCISTLIGLCTASSNEAKEDRFAEVKRKIATITTPVLVNRCKAIFRKYMADERRSGQVPLPK